MLVKINLNPIERRILQILIVQGAVLNKNELAQRARVSWNTAEKYIKKLQDKGWVGEKKIGSITYYYAEIYQKRLRITHKRIIIRWYPIDTHVLPCTTKCYIYNFIIK